MDNQYSIPEILECMEGINPAKKKIINYSDKTFTLNNTAKMKKKIIQTQGTFGDTFEIEEIEEDTFDDVEPFEIDEITKVDNSKVIKEEKVQDVLFLTNEVIRKKLPQETNNDNQKVEQVTKLNEQISSLKEYNATLNDNLNQILKTISQKGGDKEFHTKLEILYEQQNIIKDYEKQISALKEKNQTLEQKFELPPSWLTGDFKYDHNLNDNTKKSSEILNQEEYEEELKTKSKIIYEQQNIVKDYQDQILKLKEENKLLKQNLELKNHSSQDSELVTQQENNQTEMKDMVRKIKHYQDDNLRLSNEVVQQSNRLENLKNQLKNFENNKTRLMSQLENLNNIISENNVIDNSFSANVSKVEKKIEVEKKVTGKKPLVKDQFRIISKPEIQNAEELNRLTKEIFDKK